MKKTIAALLLAGSLLAAAVPASARDMTIHYPIPVANAMADYYIHGVGATPYGMPQGYANAPYGGYAPYPGYYYAPQPYPAPAYERPDSRGWRRDARERGHQRWERRDRRWR